MKKIRIRLFLLVTLSTYLQQSFAWDKIYKISTDFCVLQRIGFNYPINHFWYLRNVNHTQLREKLCISNSNWHLGISHFNYKYESYRLAKLDDKGQFLMKENIYGYLKVRFVSLNLGYTYFKYKKFESTFNLGFSVYNRKSSSYVKVNYLYNDSVVVTKVPDIDKIRMSYFFENKFVWNLKYAQAYVTFMYQPWNGILEYPSKPGFPDVVRFWSPPSRNLFLGAGVSLLLYQREYENKQKG